MAIWVGVSLFEGRVNWIRNLRFEQSDWLWFVYRCVSYFEKEIGKMIESSRSKSLSHCLKIVKWKMKGERRVAIIEINC